MAPKFPQFRPVEGLQVALKSLLMPPATVLPWNCVWFQTLKNSARNCRLLPRVSLKTKFLKKEMFQFGRPGPRTELRVVLPQVPAAGAE